jgi:hypothetical protein
MAGELASVLPIGPKGSGIDVIGWPNPTLFGLLFTRYGEFVWLLLFQDAAAVIVSPWVTMAVIVGSKPRTR